MDAKFRDLLASVTWFVAFNGDGKSRSKGLYVVAGCRCLSNDYLSTERLRDDPEGTATPLMLAGVGERFMSQHTVQYVLNHIVDAANKGRDVADR